MINDSKVSGFAILTDLKGKLIELVEDDIGIKGLISENKDFISLIDNESKEKAKQFLNTLRNQKVTFDWELNIKIENRIINLSFAAVVLENSLLIMGSTLGHDIEILYEEFSRTNNELTNIQREITKKNIELESLNQQKNRFVGMASHDLRTPLSTILTYSEFLIDEGTNLNEEQIKFIEIIKSSTYFMLTLIDDLLDISKIESGNINLELTKTNLSALIENNISINKIIANKKYINIISVIDKNLPELFIDIGKIDQVLNNLISNAIKFSFPNTTIEIRAEYNNNEVIISVKDQGQGIPQGEIVRLFKYFTKTSVRSTAGEKSSGLGLAIVKKIVEEHKGKIWVESIINKGSTFFITLPF